MGRAEEDKAKPLVRGLNFGGAEGFSRCTSLPFLTNDVMQPCLYCDIPELEARKLW